LAYEFVKRQSGVLEDYVMSFLVNTDVWPVSVDCLNTLIMMKKCWKMR